MELGSEHPESFTNPTDFPQKQLNAVHFFILHVYLADKSRSLGIGN